MKTKSISYQRHRFPSEIISHAVWLHHRFCLSFREVEERLAERSITVNDETVRQWCQKFGPAYARRLKKRQGQLGDAWHLDEVFVSIPGQRFLTLNGLIQNQFSLGRHLINAVNYWLLRTQAFQVWKELVCA